MNLSQLTLVVGGAVVIGGLLLAMVVIIHKAFKDRRQAEPFVAKSPRTDDEANFAMAAMQGVIAKMKEQEKELVELRQDAERRARESARLSENVLREMPNGLLVFNREGFLTTANPAVRTLLNVDTWARRRYPEILRPGSSLAQRVQDLKPPAWWRRRRLNTERPTGASSRWEFRCRRCARRAAKWKAQFAW